jgi:putative membrane protein
MRRTGLLSLAVTAAITLGGCSNTESTKTGSAEQPKGAAVGTGGVAANTKDDGDFVRDMAVMNMAEIELSRMALAKSTQREIKAFAQRLIGDHGAAGDKLKSAVSEQSIEWPRQLDEKHRKDADEVAKKQGAVFDRDYLEAIVHGHQDFTAKLESRLDLQSVEEWKTAVAGRAQGKALPEPGVEMTDVKVRPDKSNTDIGTKINQWAAETYPIAQKHLDTARTLENAIKKRSTN